MSLFKRVEKRAVSVGLTDPESWWKNIETDHVATYTGRAVNSSTALQMSAVYYCAGLISDAIASLPLDTFLVSGKRRKQVESPTWLTHPNPNMTPLDFWHRVMTSLLLEGNAFILTLRDKDEIIALYPIHPDYVEIEDNPNGNLYYVNNTTLTQNDMLHIPGFTVAGQSRGVSVIEAARQSIGLGLTAEEFGARFFGQGTAMSGVIEVPTTLDPKEARRLKADFSKSNSGVKSSHAIGVLTGGATWRPVSVTPEEAQFLETRKFSKVDIALFFRVPPHMVDPTVSSTWGTGVEEQNWAFVQNTLQPWLVRLEQAITLYLLNDGFSVHFNLDSRLRAKTKERLEAYKEGIQNGIYNMDEVRGMEDLPPLPNGLGKKFYIPGNVIEVTDVPPQVQLAEAQAKAAQALTETTPQDQVKQKDEKKSFRYNHNHGADGKFISAPFAAEPIYQNDLSNPNTPRTRGVTRDEFNSLAAEGKKRLDGFQSNHTEPTAFTDEKSWQAIKDQAWEESRPDWGGSTIDGHTGKFMKGNEDAYALTVKPNNLEPVSVSPTASREEFDAAMDTARQRFGKQLSYENHKLGVFNDADSKRIDIDPVLVVKDHHDVETIGSFTHSVGGAYRFSDGNGYWPPYVKEEGAQAA